MNNLGKAVLVLGFWLIISSFSLSLAEEPGLVGMWSFDNGVGQIAKDSSGSMNDGRIFGAAWVDGIKGKALRFDGRDDSVDVGDDPSLNITKAITIEAWIQGENWSTSPWHCIARKNDAYSLEVAKGLEGKGGVCLTLWGKPEGNFLWAQQQVEESESYYLAATWDGFYMKIYVNGVQRSETKPYKGTLNITSAHLNIGAWDGSNHPFNGIIDEVRVYNRALSSEEVEKHFNEISPSATEKRASSVTTREKKSRGKPILAGLWHFDEGKGEMTRDSSSRGNDALISNVNWEKGLEGNCLRFKGKENSYIQVNGKGTLEDRTISLWIKPELFKGVDIPFLSYGTPAGSGDIFRIDEAGFIRVNWSQEESKIPVKFDSWNQITITYKQGIFSLYLNGVLVSSQEIRLCPLKLSGFWIGGNRLSLGVWRESFIGLIDEVKLYGQVLSPEKIKENYLKEGGNLPAYEEIERRLREVARYRRGENRFGPFYCVSVNEFVNGAAVHFMSRLGYGTIHPYQRAGDPFLTLINVDTVVRNGIPYQPIIDKQVILNKFPGGKVNWALASHGTTVGVDKGGNTEFINNGFYDVVGWFAGGGTTKGTLTLNFPEPRKIDNIRFVSPRPVATPISYTVEVKEEGKQSFKVLRRITGEVSTSDLPYPWRQFISVPKRKRFGREEFFTFEPLFLTAIRLNVTNTVFGELGPEICEFEAWGDAPARNLPRKVEIPVGLSADEVYFLGNVGFNGYPEIKEKRKIARYVLVYEDGEKEDIPLINGINFASYKGVSFVPEAHPGFYFNDRDLPEEEIPQLFWLSHKPKKNKIIKSIIFESVDKDISPVLSAITVRKGGRPLWFFNDEELKQARSVKPDVIQNERYYCLNGNWKYKTDQGKLGRDGGYSLKEYDDSSWEKMKVPSNWYLEGLDYFGAVWYRHEFRVPERFRGKNVSLRFEAVSYYYKVWLNNHYLGSYKCGSYYNPFEFDVTEYLNYEGDNILAVEVDYPLNPGGFSRFSFMLSGEIWHEAVTNGDATEGGIWRSVYLVESGPVTVDDVYIKSNKLSKGNKNAEVEFIVTLNNRSKEDYSGRLRINVSGKNFKGGEYVIEEDVSLKPGESIKKVTKKITNPKLWWTWDYGKPNLYLAKTEVLKDNIISDTKKMTFGIRSVEIEGYGHWRTTPISGYGKAILRLNGEKIFLRGAHLQQQLWGSTLNREIRKRDLLIYKDAGVNSIRMGVSVDIPEFYDLCDEMGILVLQGMPHPCSWPWSYTKGDEMIKMNQQFNKNLRNHPSIWAFIGPNEWGQGSENWIVPVCESLEEIDDTRPIAVSCAGMWPCFDTHYDGGEGSILFRKTIFHWLGYGMRTMHFNTEGGAVVGTIDIDSVRRHFGGENIFPYDGLSHYWNGAYWWSILHLYEFPRGNIPIKNMEDLRKAYLTYCRKPLLHKYRGSKYTLEHYRIYKYKKCSAFHIFYPWSNIPKAFSYTKLNYDRTPKVGWQAVKEAYRPILPALEFDTTDISAVWIVNDTLKKMPCKLRYIFKEKKGQNILSKGEKEFTLLPNSSTKLVDLRGKLDLYNYIYKTGRDVEAKLELFDEKGKLMVANEYEFPYLEIAGLWLNILPFPTTGKPICASFWEGEAVENKERGKVVEIKGGYNNSGLVLDGTPENIASAAYKIAIPYDGKYCLKIACKPEQRAGITVCFNGKKYTQMNITGDNRINSRYTETEENIKNRWDIVGKTKWANGVGWYELRRKGADYIFNLKKGTYTFTFQTEGELTIDAFCMQKIPEGIYMLTFQD